MAVAVGEVLFERWVLMVGGVLERAVVVHGGHCAGGVTLAGFAKTGSCCDYEGVLL